MNPIIVSDKNYRLYAGTLAECKEFGRGWAIKNKRSHDLEGVAFDTEKVGAPLTPV